METDLLDGSDHLGHTAEVELAHDGRRDDRIDPVFLAAVGLLEQIDDIRHERFVGDSPERTAIDAGAAGDALVVIDLGFPFLVHRDGLDLTALDAGTVARDDGLVRTYLAALAALDAL